MATTTIVSYRIGSTQPSPVQLQLFSFNDISNFYFQIGEEGDGRVGKVVLVYLSHTHTRSLAQPNRRIHTNNTNNKKTTKQHAKAFSTRPVITYVLYIKLQIFSLRYPNLSHPILFHPTPQLKQNKNKTCEWMMD